MLYLIFVRILEALYSYLNTNFEIIVFISEISIELQQHQSQNMYQAVIRFYIDNSLFQFEIKLICFLIFRTFAFNFYRTIAPIIGNVDTYRAPTFTKSSCL